MPQNFFSSIASLATSHRKETPQISDENRPQQPESRSYPQKHPGSQQQLPGYQLQPPGAQQQPPGYQLQPPGTQQQPPGSQQQPPGYQLQPPGTQQQPLGFQLQPPGLQPQPYGPQNQPSGVQLQPSGPHQQPSGTPQQPPGPNQQPSIPNQQPLIKQQHLGFQQQPKQVQQQQIPQQQQQHITQQKLLHLNQLTTPGDHVLQPSAIPSSLHQTISKPQNLPLIGAKSLVGQTPVNEHEVDPANTKKEEQAQANKSAATEQYRNSLSPGSSQEVRHTIVTLQPQIHPGKVPPIKISTRIQPTISPPKQEQLSDDEDSKVTVKDDSKLTEDNSNEDGEGQTSTEMEVDEVVRDGSRDIGIMTSTNMRTMLDGMVLTETQGGLLVVNVMYKNKEFVGTLMECTSPTHSWGAPRHSDVPPPDKKPKKKKKSKSEKLAPRIGLRNRRRMKRRDKREKRLSWDRTNRPAAKQNK